MTKEETKQFNIRIAESLYNEIKAEADKQKITMTDYVISKLTADSNNVDNSYVEDLKVQLNQQAETIQNRDAHIQELTQLVDQQQQLTLHSNKQVEYLQLEIEATEKNDTADKKQGFFSRLFNL